MKVSGFTFVRNGVKYDYPFLESITSLLPLCDEVVIAAGQSVDDTRERIQSLRSSKIKLIATVWDDSRRKGGEVLAQQTNMALERVSGDWAIYLQADEVLHENDYEAITNAMERYKDEHGIEGLLLKYVHFYGSYEYIGNSRRWYRREIRIVRPGIGVRSWGDAQGFRIRERKLRVKLIDATVHHYGWVKPPEVQQLKQKHFNKFWHSDDWIGRYVGNECEYDYTKGGALKLFEGTHPSVMRDRIHRQNWIFKYNPLKVHRPLKEIILDWIESLCGWRIGEYKNYRLI